MTALLNSENICQIPRSKWIIVCQSFFQIKIVFYGKAAGLGHNSITHTLFLHHTIILHYAARVLCTLPASSHIKKMCTYKRPIIKTCKDVQYHLYLGKYESKLQWYATSPIRMDFHKKFKNPKYQVLVRMGKIGTFVRCWWEFLNKNPATMENRM